MVKKSLESQEELPIKDEIPEHLKNDSATLKIIDEVLRPDNSRLLDMSRLTAREKPLMVIAKMQAMIPRMNNARRVGDILNLEEELISLLLRVSRAGGGKLIEDAHRINKVEAEKGKDDSLAADNWG
jgi:hypothetical protein